MNYEATPANVTQSDVAKALGLSQATVSLALRGDLRISEKRRKEIREFAVSMGYRPSSAASALAHLRHSGKGQARGEVLGWINFWPDSKYLHRLDEFRQYYLGACETADKLGYVLTEFTPENGISPKRLQQILIARGIEGILLPPHPVDFKFEGLDWSQFSFLKFGHSIAEPRGHIVSPDQTYNTVLAFQEIRKRGYQRIGYIEGPSDYFLFDAGFLKAQRTVRAKDRIPIFTYDHREKDKAPLELEKWLRRFQPDAVISSSGIVPGVLKEIGWRIPEDVAIAATSIRDGKVSAGIDQNPYEIGRVGILSLIALLHDNDRGIPERYREVLVKGRWVDGESLPLRASS